MNRPRAPALLAAADLRPRRPAGAVAEVAGIPRMIRYDVGNLRRPEFNWATAKAVSVSGADDVLNLERLQEAFEDDRPAIANLLGLARDTEARYIRALRDGMAREDIRAVAGAAHSIKGSASNIGALRVSKVASDIENLARAQKWDGIAAFADELDRVYAELSVRIGEYAADVT